MKGTLFAPFFFNNPSLFPLWKDPWFRQFWRLFWRPRFCTGSIQALAEAGWNKGSGSLLTRLTRLDPLQETRWKTSQGRLCLFITSDTKPYRLLGPHFDTPVWMPLMPPLTNHLWHPNTHLRTVTTSWIPKEGWLKTFSDIQSPPRLQSSSVRSRFSFHITVNIFSWTGKAGENVSKFRIGGHLMRDQTVGSNICEGGAWPGKQGRLGIAIDWVTGRSSLFSERAQCTVRPT